MTTELPALIKQPEVLRLLGVSRDQLRRIVQDGHLPAPVRLAKKQYAYRRSDVLKLVAG